MTIEANDVAGYIFGQPGNDRTYLLVQSIDGDNAKCWDLVFNFEVTVPVERCWKASEKELDSMIHAFGRTVSYRQLADERRAASRT